MHPIKEAFFSVNTNTPRHLSEGLSRTASPGTAAVEHNKAHCLAQGWPCTKLGTLLCSQWPQLAPSRQAFAHLHRQGCSAFIIMRTKLFALQELETTGFEKDISNPAAFPTSCLEGSLQQLTLIPHGSGLLWPSDWSTWKGESQPQMQLPSAIKPH